MAGVQVIEQVGRALSKDTFEARYIVTGTMSQRDARAAVLDESPPTYETLIRQDARVEEIKGQVGHWLAEVSYLRSSAAPPEEGQQWFAMNSRVETTKVLRSRQTMGAFAPAGETPANFERAINVTPDGVEGVDVHVPVHSFTVTRYVAPSVGADSNYIRAITRTLATVNASEFRVRTAMDATGSVITFQPHEALLIGAAFGRQGDQPWQFTFEFAASPSIDDLNLSGIAGITKRGWDYLWLRYETFEDETSKTLIRKPISAYVENVYAEADFNALRIAG